MLESIKSSLYPLVSPSFWSRVVPVLGFEFSVLSFVLFAI